MSEVIPTVPDHELFGVIGRGAFGEVWLGRNVMGIWRAIKIIRRSDFSGPESYEREFEAIRRYEPVARSTEGLVQVLHVGRHDAEGYFYYIMELADDEGSRDHPERATAVADPGSYVPRSLRSELARRGRVDLDEVLGIASALGRGLIHLHNAGLVHRDIKPSNVIFVQGRARLADMGLVDHQGHLSFAGTAGYVAPEGTGTPSADLYSLGLVIYEMATGCDRKQFPQLPADWLARRDPRQWEIHEVILRACEGLPERRYGSAAELKADLAMISSGQSVRERRALAARSRRLKVAGIIATVGFILASVWALLFRQRAAMENEARLDAEHQSALTELALVESHLAQAAANRQTGLTGQRYETLARITEALTRLRGMGPGARSVVALSPAREAELMLKARNEAIAALNRVDLRELGRWPAVCDRQWGLPLDPGLRRLAIAGPGNSVVVLAIPEGVELARLPAGPAEVERPGPFSRDGTHLMVRYKNGENLVWDLERRRMVFRQARSPRHLRAVFWRGGLLTPRAEGGLVWNSLGLAATERIYPTRESLMWLMPADDEEHLVGFTPDFAEACRFAGEPLIELQRCRLPAVFNMGEFAMSREGQFLALTVSIGRVPLLDLADPHAVLPRLSGHAAEVVAAAFHPDGRHLASSSWDGTTRIWDWTAGESRLLHDDWTGALRFSVDGSRCAWASSDSQRQIIVLWEFAAPRSLWHWRIPLPPDTELERKISARAAFSPGSRWLAVGTGYGVRLLSVPGLEQRAVIGTNEVYSVRFASREDRLFTAGADGQWLWSLDWSALRTPLRSNDSCASNFAVALWHGPRRTQHFTLGGNDDLLACVRDHRVSYRDAGSAWSSVTIPEDQLWLATSQKGTWLAVSTAERLHQFHRVQRTNLWTTPLRGFARFDFSPDERHLAVLDADGLRCMEAASGRVRWRLPRADLYLRVGDLGWSSDGRWLAAALQRRDISLIDTRAGRVVARLTNPSQGSVVSALFSPDGRYLAVTLADQSAQLWDLQTLRADLASSGLDWDE
jgi:WD40 repeat protein